MAKNPRKIINYHGTDCHLNIGNYPKSKLAMSMWLTDAQTKEQMAVLSVNLGNYQTDRDTSFVQFGSTYLDTNNYPDAQDVIESAGLGVPYTAFGAPQYGHSGWCEYPLMEMNMDELKKYDPEGFSTYEATWKEEMPKEQAKLMEAMFGQSHIREQDFDFDEDDEPTDDKECE